MPLVHNRLRVILARLERMIARFEAGKAMQRLPRAAGVGSVAEVLQGRAESFWPLAFGWLTDEMKHHATVYTGRMEIVLSQPAMVALLIASPQARHALRPLCRMLAINPALLRPRAPGEPAVVVAVKEKKKRVRAKRVPVEPWRTPFPRGVLAWARREGYGKLR
jgi:hypothetical protein